MEMQALYSQSDQNDHRRTDLGRLKLETGAEVEIISGIPVFTISPADNNTLSAIAKLYGEEAVFRIINANFIEDAIRFGIDKANVGKHDFRRIIGSVLGYGLDIWGVEKEATEIGLGKEDVFCASHYDCFFEGERKDKYRSAGIGIPEDRSAVLVFDIKKLRAIGVGKDSYVFIDPKNKRDALLGIIRFKEKVTEFEKRLRSLESVDAKIQLLEVEVFQNLNTADDLGKTPYLALNIMKLLYRESLENVGNPSILSTDRINRLKAIADRLEYEIIMIAFVDYERKQLGTVRETFAAGNRRKLDDMRVLLDYVIRDVIHKLQQGEIDNKYEPILFGILEEAMHYEQNLG